jgi:protein-tyrosine phosphatase
MGPFLRKASMVQVTRIWERLYLGGRNDAERLYQSNPFNITTVVSLCEEEVIRHNLDINYIHIPIADASRLGVGQFDAIIDAIAENVRWGTVLLHCGSGVSRAPIMTAAWMHVAGYKNVDGALEEIAELRPIIAPSKILLSSVRRHLK